MLSRIKDSILIDVRTREEWNFVGKPDLTSIGKEVVFLSWRFCPDMSINSNFANELKELCNINNNLMFFICRSGHRSFEAASSIFAEVGKNCYNITDGFEGVSSSKDHHNSLNGWKFNQLPWFQG